MFIVDGIDDSLKIMYRFKSEYDGTQQNFRQLIKFLELFMVLSHLLCALTYLYFVLTKSVLEPAASKTSAKD